MATKVVKYPNRLRECVKSSGYKMQEFAEETGIPLRTLHDYCSGKMPIPRKRLELMAEMLGYAADYLVPRKSVSDNASASLEDTQHPVGLPSEINELDKFRRQLVQRIFDLTGIAVVTPLYEAFGFAKRSVMAESWERFAAATTMPAAMNASAFQYFEQLIEVCWGLCNAGEMNIAEQVLSSFLPEMIELAPYQSEAAMLAAQGLRLQSILNAHQLKLLDMIPLCQQAVEFARLANDHNTLSAALNGLAVAFKYAQQPEASFKTYREALSCSDQASSLLRSRVFAGSAATFAQRGRQQEALFYIGFAYENFPDHPEDDPNFFSADNGIFMLAYYEGLIYLAMNQPEGAERAFESYKKHPSGAAIPERNRLEIINHQGRAAIMSNNLEKYAHCLEEGIAGAIVLKSKKRFDEALSIYHQDMPKAWLHESQIRRIAEQFQLPAGEE